MIEVTNLLKEIERKRPNSYPCMHTRFTLNIEEWNLLLNLNDWIKFPSFKEFEEWVNTIPTISPLLNRKFEHKESWYVHNR